MDKNPKWDSVITDLNEAIREDEIAHKRCISNPTAKNIKAKEAARMKVFELEALAIKYHKL
jgi:hypothetical protein